MNKRAQAQASHELEELFSRFPESGARAIPRFTARDRAAMDLIRQYYVAYSRAEHSLVLLGTKSQLNGDGVPTGPTKGWVRHRTQRL